MKGGKLLSGASYAGINRIKFAGLAGHLSAITAHPGQGRSLSELGEGFFAPADSPTVVIFLVCISPPSPLAHRLWGFERG